MSNHRAIHNQNDFKPAIVNTEIQKDLVTYPRIHSTFIIKLGTNFLYTRSFYPRQLLVSTLDKNTQNLSIKAQFFLDLGWQTQPNISFALKTLQHLIEYYVYVGKWDEFVLIHGYRQPYFSVIFFLPFKVKKKKNDKDCRLRRVLSNLVLFHHKQSYCSKIGEGRKKLNEQNHLT